MGEEVWAKEDSGKGGLGEWETERGREERGREEGEKNPCPAVGEGAMGAMKVGGGEEDDLAGREEEGGGRSLDRAEGVSEEEERSLSTGGDEAAGRTGVRKTVAEGGAAAPPATGGLACGRAAGGVGVAKA